MGAYMAGVAVALLAAAGVVVAANRGSDERTSWRTFWSDLRAGLRREDRAATDEPALRPVDVPLDTMLAQSQPGDDYLQLDELTGLLERTSGRANQMWHDARENRTRSEHPDEPWLAHPRGHRSVRSAAVTPPAVTDQRPAGRPADAPGADRG